METYNVCIAYGAGAESLAQNIKLDRKTHIHIILSCEPFAALGASKPFLCFGQCIHFEPCKALTKCFNPLNVALMRFFAPLSFAFDSRPLVDLFLLNPFDVQPARCGKLSAIGTGLIGSVVVRGR